MRRTTSDQPRRRRWLRVSGISHATVVAYLALFMAMAGTASAATGGTFILGTSNTAESQTTLTTSAGSALSLNSPAGVAPLRVNRTTKVTNLNADLLDGRDSTGFLRLGASNAQTARTTLTNTEGIPLRLTPKAGSAPLTVDSNVRVANLNADLLDGKDSSAFVAKADHDALVARVAELETLLASMSVTTVDGQPTVRFSGVNVQIVNGQGATGTANGRGNLVVGYSKQRANPAPRTGSHNLVVGDEHGWSSTSGIVVGFTNTISGPGASVTGGVRNVATGASSSVTGGTDNTALGGGAVVSGGSYNQANGFNSSVSGGTLNTTTGLYGSVSGGMQNTAGERASVSGGWNNHASGTYSSILGGNSRTVSATNASCFPGC